MKKTVLAFVAIIALCQSSKAQEPSTLKWYTLEEALELNAKQPKKIIIDVYTDWCGWCKEMDKSTFSHPYIAEYISKHFYPVKFNAERTKDVIFKGQVYKNRNRGTRSPHDFAIALLKGNVSYPSIVFMDSTSTPITVVPGYLTPEKIEPVLEYINNDLYKTEKWNNFAAKFTSKLPKPL